MSTQPNILQNRQASPWGTPPVAPPAATPDQSGGGTSANGGGSTGKPGIFGNIGKFLKENSGAIADIGNQLAAAGGNLRPMMLAHQDKEMKLQQDAQASRAQLQQSEMKNQELSRQLTQWQLDNRETPAQQRAAQLEQAGQLEALKPPTHFPAATAPGQPAGIYQQNYDPATKGFKISPATTEAQVPNPALTAQNEQSADALTPNYASGLGEFPKTNVSTTPPAPALPKTITQRQQLLQPPTMGVTYSPAGIDLDPNSPSYGQTVQYVRDKAGNPVRTISAPAGRGVLDVAAPMVSNTEHAVTQPTGEITKENFRSTRQRLLPGQHAASTGGGGGSANAAPGNFGTGPVVGGKPPTPVTQAFANIQDARNRLQVMQRDIEQINANPTGNTGSMDMDLLSQHVALTFGTVKNARGGEALIMAHIKARSVPEEIGVLYNKLKSGAQLSPEQRQNFMHLAQSRLQAYGDQYANAQKEAQGGFGMNPNAPPTPNNLSTGGGFQKF